MFDVDKFKFKVAKEKGNVGKYSIGPLPKGYGITIGNAYRRILLSSIDGAAVTSIKVANVKHEYSTLPGVMDDILTIILRLKQLALKCHSDETQTINLNVKGKKVVTAKDIKLTSDVELSNPDLYITELSDKKAKLDIEMYVEKGSGYIPSDESKRSQVGMIPLDANFSPVEKVIMDVSKTRVGQQTDLDQIDIEIHTNGVISPKEAIDQAAYMYHKISKRLIIVIKGEDIDEEEEKEEEVGEKAAVESSSSDLDIEKINLSARLTNSLLKAGFKNLTELEGKTVEEIMEIRGLGNRSAEELIDIMRSYKLEIKD